MFELRISRALDHLPVRIPSRVVKLLDGGFNLFRDGAQFLILFIQGQGRLGVLDGIVGLRLDLHPQKVPGQESKGDHPLDMRGLEQGHGVDGLILADQQVDDPEVVLEPVADEDDPDVHEEPELEIGGLECGQVFGRDADVEIARLDPRKFGHVVRHLFLGRDVVVNEFPPNPRMQVIRIISCPSL